jgi:hypothetical protein
MSPVVPEPNLSSSSQRDLGHDAQQRQSDTSDTEEPSLKSSEQVKQGDGNAEDKKEKFANSESEGEWEDWDNGGGLPVDQGRDKGDGSCVDREEEGDEFDSTTRGGEKHWDEDGDDSARKSRDDVISEEIEAELAKMSEGKRELSVKKVPTSPDPYRYDTPSPTGKDWPDDHEGVGNSVSVENVSDGSKSPGRSSAKSEKLPPRVLQSKHSSISSSSSSSTSASTSTSTTTTVTSVAGKGLKLVPKSKVSTASSTSSSSSSSSSSVSSHPKARRERGGDLGAGYDIKSIELKVVKDELDFFADMAPVIKPVTSLEGMLGLSERAEHDGKVVSGMKRGSEGKGNGVQSSLFAVADTASEVSKIVTHFCYI